MNRYFIMFIMMMFIHSSMLLCMNHDCKEVTYTYGVENDQLAELCINAYIAKRHIGTIIYSAQPNKIYNKPYVRNLLIDNNHQKHGIGSELFLLALDELLKSGCKQVMFFAIDKSEYFYKKFGARIIDVIFPEIFTIMEFDFEKDGNPRLNRYNLK